MKNKKIKRRTHSTQGAKRETTLDKTYKSILMGLGISAVVSLVLLLVGTAAALATNDPTAFVDPIGYVSLFLSAFFGGFACSKINRRAPYLTSTVCGALFVVFSMLVSFALPHTYASRDPIWSRLLLHALSLLTFPVGAFAATKAARTSHHKKRKRR